MKAIQIAKSFVFEAVLPVVLSILVSSFGYAYFGNGRLRFLAILALGLHAWFVRKEFSSGSSRSRIFQVVASLLVTALIYTSVVLTACNFGDCL